MRARAVAPPLLARFERNPTLGTGEELDGRQIDADFFAALIVALAFDDASVDRGEDLVLRIDEEPTERPVENPSAAPMRQAVQLEIAVPPSDVLEARSHGLWLSVRA